MTKREFVDKFIAKYIKEVHERNSNYCVDTAKLEKNDCVEDCKVCQKEHYEKMQRRMLKQYDESEE